MWCCACSVSISRPLLALLYCDALSPAVLLSISSLLTDANPDDPLVPDAATMCARAAAASFYFVTRFACIGTTARYSTKRRSNGRRSTRNNTLACVCCRPAALCACGGGGASWLLEAVACVPINKAFRCCSPPCAASANCSLFTARAPRVEHVQQVCAGAGSVRSSGSSQRATAIGGSRSARCARHNCIVCRVYQHGMPSGICSARARANAAAERKVVNCCRQVHS